MADNRSDWTNNDTRVMVAYLESWRVLGRMPTQNQVAFVTGLSRNTVQKHVSVMNFNKLREPGLKPLYNSLVDPILPYIANAAINGRSKKAMDLWQQLMFDRTVN